MERFHSIVFANTMQIDMKIREWERYVRSLDNSASKGVVNLLQPVKLIVEDNKLIIEVVDPTISNAS